MKLGFSTNAYIKKSLSYAIKSIYEIGYDGVELVLDSPHAFLPLKSDLTKNIQTIIKKNHIDVANLNANTVMGWYRGDQPSNPFEPSLSNFNPKLRNWRINYTKNAIDLATKLESPSICLTSGVSNGFQEKSIELFLDSIIELAIYAEQQNIKIGIEYEPGLAIDCANTLFSILNKDFKNIGFNFDVCHASTMREDLSIIVKKFNTKIFHIHISDCKNHVHNHLIPGLGDIDFDTLLFELKKIGYAGFLTAELYPYNDRPEYAAKHALNFLKKFVN